MARNPISMSDTAFDSIYSKIEKSYPNACILFIDEIKNEELEEVYNKHKSTIIKEHTEKCSKNLIVNPNEVGTHSANIDYIVNDGFDPSKNKVSAYGIGSYFATTADYSFNYMKSADKCGISYMFVVNIFIGKMKYNKSLDEGDAYVDNINNPSIFCMPLKEQALPKYLVAFHKNAR